MLANVWMLKFLFAALFSFLVTWYFIPLFISIAYKFNVVDAPDGVLKRQRSSTPYLGGVAVFVGFLVAIALVYPYYNRLFLFLVGCSLLLVVGLVDDLIQLKPYQKFFGHMIAAFCFLRCGFYLKEFFFISPYSPVGLIVGLAVSYLWILTIINAFNLIDIMDGLSSTVALCVSITFALLAIVFGEYAVALLLFSLIGGLAAFWWFNKPRARIYLGDAGSLFIGGLLSVVPFMLPWGRVHVYGYAVPVVVFAIPLLEVFSLIIIRFYKKIPFYRGSPDHFAHYLQKKGWGVWAVLCYSVGVSIFLGSLSMAFCLGVISFTLFLSLFCAFVIFWFAILVF